MYEKLMGEKPGKYKCELFGCGDAITLHPNLGHEPNWFWRLMQYLILGNRWVKIENEKPQA